MLHCLSSLPFFVALSLSSLFCLCLLSILHFFLILILFSPSRAMATPIPSTIRWRYLLMIERRDPPWQSDPTHATMPSGSSSTLTTRSPSFTVLSSTLLFFSSCSPFLIPTEGRWVNRMVLSTPFDCCCLQIVTHVLVVILLVSVSKDASCQSLCQRIIHVLVTMARSRPTGLTAPSLPLPLLLPLDKLRLLLLPLPQLRSVEC